MKTVLHLPVSIQSVVKQTLEDVSTKKKKNDKLILIKSW